MKNFFILCSAVLLITACSESEEPKPPAYDSAVIQHPAKAGVYEAFTSALFGDAGRWMTTNLAARAYDTDITTVTLPAAPNGEYDNNKPLWCYPSATSPSTSTEYVANKDLGLLYNWAAVTAATQNGNNTDEATISYPNRQGICPNGWHVPSDKEWTELKVEFTAHKNNYSSLANDGSLEHNGTAMKANNILNGINASGTSKAASQGGFAALLTGAAYGGTSSIGGNAFFWSSSSYISSSSSSGNACLFSVSSVRSTVLGGYNRRVALYSVRCKKD